MNIIWLRFFLYAYLFGEIQNSSDVARRIPDLHILSGLDMNEEGSMRMTPGSWVGVKCEAGG